MLNTYESEELLILTAEITFAFFVLNEEEINSDWKEEEDT